MLNKSSPYHDACILMTTKHAKSIAVAPAFQEILGATVAEYTLDTDQLGTFTREVEPTGTVLETARRKCEWGMNQIDADYGLANEACFEPNPGYPFIPFSLEVLYFIDRRRNFHLYMRRFHTLTSYQHATVDSVEALLQFAAGTQFPSHALVLRPNVWKPGEPIYPGIDNAKNLAYYYQLARKQSPDGLVWVATDMRAHVNPTRMAEIGLLARKLAHRLSTPCPMCHAPGWGPVGKDQRLSRNYYGQPSQQTESETYGCVLCDHTQTRRYTDYRTRYCRDRSMGLQPRQFHIAP